MIADAGLDGVDGVLPFHDRRGLDAHRALAEIDVVVLDLGRPAWCKHVFGAGADGPSPAGVALLEEVAARSIDPVLEVADRRAAAHEQQGRAGGIAEAALDVAEALELGEGGDAAA